MLAFEKNVLRSYALGDPRTREPADADLFESASVDEEAEAEAESQKRELSPPQPQKPVTPTELRAGPGAVDPKGAHRDVPRVPLCWEDQRRDRHNRFVPQATSTYAQAPTTSTSANAGISMSGKRLMMPLPRKGQPPPPKQTLEGRSLRSAICGPGASAFVPHGLPLESGVDEEGDDEAHKILQLAAAAITEASRKSAQSTPLHVRLV